MPLNAFIGMLVVLLFFGGMIWLVVRVVRKGREQVAAAGNVNAELAKLVGNAQGLYQPNQAVIGNRTVSIQLLPGGKNSPPTLRVPRHHRACSAPSPPWAATPCSAASPGCCARS